MLKRDIITFEDSLKRSKEIAESINASRVEGKPSIIFDLTGDKARLVAR